MRDRPTKPRINPLDNEARAQHWSQGTTLAEKLYGSKEDLLQATGTQKTKKYTAKQQHTAQYTGKQLQKQAKT